MNAVVERDAYVSGWHDALAQRKQLQDEIAKAEAGIALLRRIDGALVAAETVRRDTLLEIAAYCDRHGFDMGGGIDAIDGPAWVNAMHDVAQHCRLLATP